MKTPRILEGMKSPKVRGPSTSERVHAGVDSLEETRTEQQSVQEKGAGQQAGRQAGRQPNRARAVEKPHPNPAQVRQ